MPEPASTDDSIRRKNQAWKLDFAQKKMQESGFQLEDKAYLIFEENLERPDTEQNYHFTDWETGEDRELDLKITYTVDAPFLVDYIFLIECKQLPDTFWSLIRSRQQRMIFKHAFSAWDQVGKMGRQEIMADILKPIFKFDQLTCDTYSQSYKEFCACQKEQNKSSQSNNRLDNLRSAEVKLAKAFSFEKGDALQGAEMTRYWEDMTDHLQIFYPMIVFQGILMEADMGFDPPHMRFINSAHLRHHSIQNKEPLQMIIDIIHIDYLQEFIKTKFLPEAKQISENCYGCLTEYASLVKSLRIRYVK